MHWFVRWLAFAMSALLMACGGGGGSASAAGSASSASTPAISAPPVISAARALPLSPIYTVYYGTAKNIDIERVSSTFDVIVIDADPATGTPAFSAAQIAALKANGAKVLSYLNLGACETSRTYWSTVPAGFVSCGANTAAQIARYQGYAEYWMNPANTDYQDLIVNYVAPRLAATGIDGFMLDNFEIVGHGTSSSNAPCDAACAQGGIDLVRQLRDRFPDLAMVPNNAPVSSIGGTTGGVSFPWLIDGVIAEQVFLPSTNSVAVQQLQTWHDTERNLGRTAFFTGSLDYASSCTAATTAQVAWNASLQAGFSLSIATSALDSVCWWSFLSS